MTISVAGNEKARQISPAGLLFVWRAHQPEILA
jgi:hypothetical protein